MRVRILGSAAGGGLPQWNCRCANCQAVRAGSADVQPRTQSSVAISADGRAWYLLNVSADVRQQILRCADLAPPEQHQRGTSIAGCVLTDAEIDHTSGLLQLREGCTFGIFSTPLVHRWLTQYLPIGPVLDNFAERTWTELPLGIFCELRLPNGQPSGLKVRAFSLGDDTPRYVPAHDTETAGAVVGLQIQDTSTGGTLVYAPGAASINEPLIDAAEHAQCVLLDGTFWTEDEPIRTGITERTAREMGHVPVSGPRGSLKWLAGLPARHRVYVHINNTNPMLNESGSEQRQVHQQGVRVGMDGDTFTL